MDDDLDYYPDDDPWTPLLRRWALLGFLALVAGAALIGPLIVLVW